MGLHSTPLLNCSYWQQPGPALPQLHIRVYSVLSGEWHLAQSVPTLSNASFTLTSNSPTPSDLSYASNLWGKSSELFPSNKVCMPEKYPVKILSRCQAIFLWFTISPLISSIRNLIWAQNSIVSKKNIPGNVLKFFEIHTIVIDWRIYPSILF